MMRFTLYGLLNYMPDLFDGVSVPPPLDREALIKEIIYRSGDLYCYYQVPDRMKENISNWFMYRYEDFNMMSKALFSNYNPIENYDRIEETTETPNITRTNSGTESGTNGNTSNATVESKVSAYDVSTYSPNNQNTTSVQDTANTSNQFENSQRETGTKTITSHVHGNVGVTTSQQMIQSELELRKFNLYEFIAVEFENKFLIQVY